MVPKRVNFFMWTTAHDWILTLDTLMLWSLPLANRCYMCCRNKESINHLLLHCPIAHSLWVQMLQVFRIQWVMLGSLESLVFCWSNWLEKFFLNIWNMVPSCLMWVVWMERNWHSFETKEKLLVQLQALCQSTLYDWSTCWGSSNCSSILEFLTSLRIVP